VGFNPRKRSDKVVVASATIETIYSAVADATSDVIREHTVPEACEAGDSIKPGA